MNTIKMLSDYSFVCFIMFASCIVCSGFSNLISRFGEDNMQSILDINRYDRSSWKVFKLISRGFLGLNLLVLKILGLKEFSIFWGVMFILSVVTQLVK